MRHAFQATFAKPAKVKLVQIFFGEKSGLFKLDVLVTAGSKLIY